MRGGGKKVNTYSNVYRGYQCPQRRTIPFTHYIQVLVSQPPALCSQTCSATWAANQTTRGKSLLDKSSVVNSRSSAKLHEWCLQVVGLGMDGEAVKCEQWQTALLWHTKSREEPLECQQRRLGKTDLQSCPLHALGGRMSEQCPSTPQCKAKGPQSHCKMLKW